MANPSTDNAKATVKPAPTATQNRVGLLLLATAAIAYWAYREGGAWYAYQTYTPHTAQITEQFKRRAKRGYTYHVRYQYTWEDRPYASTDLTVTRKLYQQVEPGTPLRVRVNPADPAESQWLHAVQFGRLERFFLVWFLGVLPVSGSIAFNLWRAEDDGRYVSRFLPTVGRGTAYALRAAIFAALLALLTAGAFQTSRALLPTYAGPFTAEDGSRHF